MLHMRLDAAYAVICCNMLHMLLYAAYADICCYMRHFLLYAAYAACAVCCYMLYLLHMLHKWGGRRHERRYLWRAGKTAYFIENMPFHAGFTVCFDMCDFGAR